MQSTRLPCLFSMQSSSLCRAARQAVLWGVSYDATLAFFSVAEGHPAIRGAALLYPFWYVQGPSTFLQFFAG